MGFEPTRHYYLLVFETSTLIRSATSPMAVRGIQPLLSPRFAQPRWAATLCVVICNDVLALHHTAWRTLWDSNPRSFSAHTLSKRAR